MKAWLHIDGREIERCYLNQGQEESSSADLNRTVGGTVVSGPLLPSTEEDGSGDNGGGVAALNPKMARLKQAKDEAEKEIAEYRAH
ncbi:hypothetical protein HHK36_009581 [Tetracentron sinense]|uniref:Uncharacterized protein n=1 Tax=Tetracentron sinense TaxID=13715 RepID=A0A834ZGG3_TETSI|nr:hypothetical protein HHK36_009581 [Tetracentron sinense]